MKEKQYIDHLQKLWDERWPSELPREWDMPFGEVPLTTYLRKWAQTTPDKPCVIYYGMEMTFKQLDDWTDAFASYLSSHGAKKGDRVAVFLPNCPQFLIAFYGILKAGCVHVPVNPMFKKEELLYELNDTKAKVVVTLDQLYPLVQSVINTTSVKEVITTRLKDFLPKEPTIPLHEAMLMPEVTCSGAVSLKSVLEQGAGTPLEVDVGLDDLASLNYTGGTTGMPKGCMHTQRNMIVTMAGSCTYTYQLSPEEIRLTYLPVFWIAGENSGILAPIFSGATHILLYRWDKKAVLEAIQTYKVTCLGGVLDNIVEMMEDPEFEHYDLRSIKTTAVTSFVKKLTVEYREKWKEKTGSILQESSYGMTETHTGDTFTTGFQNDNLDLSKQSGFVGIPMPGTRFKICDFDTGELLPLGQSGEIAVQAPSLMKGYWNKPEQTQQTLRNGWLHTGDIGVIDEEGFIYYKARKKEMLKVNGMSVFPSEIEVMITKIPGVEGCGVVGKDDSGKGQIPVAYVQLESEYKGILDENKIYQLCKENMAIYKVPIVKIIDQLPLTATGKISKIQLQKLQIQQE